MEIDYINNRFLDLEQFANNLLALEDHEASDFSCLAVRLTELCELASKVENERQTRIYINKEGFNIFDCLTKHHLEELHSRMLHYLLDPSAEHGFGTLFLQLFLETLAEDKIAEAEEAIQKFVGSGKMTGVATTREMGAGIAGRMDIFVEMPGLILLIENKIYAPEQTDQIPRYISYCESRGIKEQKRFLVLFLTIEGRKSLQGVGLPYHCISYRTHIIKWLTRCMKAIDKYTVAKSGIGFYLDMLNKRILHVTSNEMLMKIQEFLLQPQNRVIIKYLREMHDALVPLRNHLRVQFFSQVVTYLHQEGYKFSPVKNISTDITIAEIWDTQDRGLRLNHPGLHLKIDDTRELRFFIEHDWSDLYFGLVQLENNQPQNVNWDDPRTKQFIEGLKEDLRWTLKNPEYCWFAWKLTETFGDTKFNDDKLNYDLAEKMDTMAAAFVKEIKEYLLAFEKRLMGIVDSV